MNKTSEFLVRWFSKWYSTRTFSHSVCVSHPLKTRRKRKQNRIEMKRNENYAGILRYVWYVRLGLWLQQPFKTTMMIMVAQWWCDVYTDYGMIRNAMRRNLFAAAVAAAVVTLCLLVCNDGDGDGDIVDRFRLALVDLMLFSFKLLLLLLLLL